MSLVYSAERIVSRDWIILRTAGRSTVLLAKTLGKDGFDVWTPTIEQRVRVPRMNTNRVVTIPLLPSFIFAKADHLTELLHMAQMEEKPRRTSEHGEAKYHRDFSVFHYLDQIPTISDADLEPLRQKVIAAIPKSRAPRFDRGSKVRVKTGAFEGLKGRVERCNGGYALVIFDDWKRPAKIPTFLLSTYGVEQSGGLRHSSGARGLDEAA